MGIEAKPFCIRASLTGHETILYYWLTSQRAIKFSFWEDLAKTVVEDLLHNACVGEVIHDGLKVSSIITSVIDQF